MDTITFYKKDEKLYVKCSKRKVVILDIVRLALYSFLIYLAYDIVSTPKQPFSIVGLTFALPFLVIGIAGWAITIRNFILNGLIVIKKSGNGYMVQNGGKLSRQMIQTIIQIQTLGLYSPSYLVAVGYAENDSFVLFREIPATDAGNLVKFLSAETGLTVNFVGINT